jgi:hypothetical protein
MLSKEENEKFNNQILELIIAAAQPWRSKKDSKVLLNNAFTVAKKKVFYADESFDIMEKKFKTHKLNN